MSPKCPRLPPPTVSCQGQQFNDAGPPMELGQEAEGEQLLRGKHPSAWNSSLYSEESFFPFPCCFFFNLIGTTLVNIIYIHVSSFLGPLHTVLGAPHPKPGLLLSPCARLGPLCPFRPPTPSLPSGTHHSLVSACEAAVLVLFVGLLVFVS